MSLLLAANIATLVLIIYEFGKFTPYGVRDSNLIVILVPHSFGFKAFLGNIF